MCIIISMSEDATLALDWPDSLTPVFGFRAWKFDNSHHGIDFPLVLRSLSSWRQIWWDSTGWTFASCQKPMAGRWKHQPRCPGPVPNIECECGCYAYHRAQRLTYTKDKIVGAVIGQGMSEYGVIRHGREGWRSEMAKPIAFVRPGVGNAFRPSDSEAPRIIEELADRLGAKLFNDIAEMEHWVRFESGYESFWTNEDELKYLEEYNERMCRHER